jgi:hypothetical protein
MSFDKDGWEKDFPRVMHFFDRKNLYRVPSILLKDKEKFPDYHAAKWDEDLFAAIRLVKSIVNTPENIIQLHELKHKHPDAILTAVIAEEAGGKNKLPIALMAYIANKVGFKVDMNIVQSNKVCHTGADAWHRMAFRPKFDGKVKSGYQYILIDDVCAHGGTFSEMRYYIEKRGGHVVHTAALALGGHGDQLASPPKLRGKLVDKFGANNLKFFCEECDLYEGNYKCFTAAEGKYLIEYAKTLDQARDRIFETRRKGLLRDGKDIAEGRKTSTLSRSSRDRDGGIER